MSVSIGRPGGLLARRQRRRLPKLSTMLMLGLAGWAGVSLWQRPGAAPEPVTAEAAKPEPAKTAAGVAYGPLSDPRFALGHTPATLERSAPLPPWRAAAIPGTTPVTPISPAAKEQLAALPLPPLAPPNLVQTVPLPLPRPPGLVAPAPAEPPRLAAPRTPRRSRVAAVPAVPEDNRSFFEKLFGFERQTGTALAYAAPQDDIVDSARGRRLSPLAPPSQSVAAGTAVYDISERVVHMPNGERLEAHSGLGDKMDDVRFAHVRMQGVTPPHVYDLTEREALFHGHRAIRLNPVGGSGAIFGRAGLLAHPYLLGPRGDSNGCVSFRDYDRFLQAFLRGEVKRLVVVAKMG